MNYFIKIILVFIAVIYLGGCGASSAYTKKITFDKKEYDRIIFVYKDKKLEFPLKEKETIIKFNDCKPHLLDKYKNNKITLKSLSMCETDLKIIKYKDKYYMSGNLNIYTDYSFYELFGNRSQVFNKKTIGIITDFERFVYGLKTKGDELNIGLNEKESYGGIKVYIIPASKKNSTNPMN